MALNFTQTNTTYASTTCIYAELVACSGRSQNGTNSFGRVATVGGTAGTAEVLTDLTSLQTNIARGGFICQVDAGVSWDAGTWTVRFNVTTANMNLTVTEIHICRVDTNCVSQATIGSATGLSIGLGTTGVKSQNVTGSAQSPSVGDFVFVVLVMSNGAMSTQTVGITVDQNIDSPFTDANISIAPGVGALTFTGQAPSVFVLDSKTASPGVGALTLTGKVPTLSVSDHVRITADVGLLTLTGAAPVVTASDNVNVAAGVGTLTITGQAPTVAKTDNVFITTGLAALTLTGYAPEVSKHITVEVGQLTFTGYAPALTVTEGAQFAPGVGQLVLAGHAPTLSQTTLVFITPDTGALVINGQVPTVSKTDNVFITAGAGALTVTGYAPTFTTTANVLVTTDVGALAITGYAPSVVATAGGDVSVNPGVGALQITGLAPTLSVTGEEAEAVWGRGGEWTKDGEWRRTKRKRRYNRPYYYYQQLYPDVLAKVNEPADEQTFDATIKAAKAITTVISRLDDNDNAFAEMLAYVRRIAAETEAYIKSAKVQRMMDETENFIKAAKDAQMRDMQEAEELEELMMLL